MCETESEPQPAKDCKPDSQSSRVQTVCSTMSEPDPSSIKKNVDSRVETVTKLEPKVKTSCEQQASSVADPQASIECNSDIPALCKANVHGEVETLNSSDLKNEDVCQPETATVNGTKAAPFCEPWVRDFIIDLTMPVVFNNMVDDWEIIGWDVEDWTAVFDDEDLPVRGASNTCSAFPLWEGQCEAESMTVEELADLDPDLLEEDKKWYYFDYKYLRDWLPEGNDSLKSLTWAKFGYPEYEVNDSTLWIGTKGAHTPLHYDTYGANLVAQIHGTKRWFLFPPKSKHMKPTRVPYEESSIYSTWNFNSPLPSEFFTVSDREVYIVDLKPGQVLFVPQHWWHFVESLDTTISVNIWLPCKSDDEYRLEESLVRLMMHRICSGLGDEDRSDILNPNEHAIGNGKTHMFQSMNMVNMLISSWKDTKQEEEEIKRNRNETTEEPPLKKLKMDVSAGDVSSKLKILNGMVVECSSLEKLKSLMDAKCYCSSKEAHDALIITEKKEKEEKYSTKIEKIINSFLDPDIMAQVLKKFARSHNLDCK